LPTSANEVSKPACMVRSQALLLKAQPMAHEDYGMCAGKKVAVMLSTLLLLFSVAANAQTCVKVDDDNTPAAIVSGRITTHHKLPKGSEGRTGDGPWLILDQPLLGNWVLLQMAENRHPDRRAI